MLIDLVSQFPSRGADGGTGSLSTSVLDAGVLCPTCLLDAVDGFCSCCGATVKSTGPHGSPIPGSAVRAGREPS